MLVVLLGKFHYLWFEIVVKETGLPQGSDNDPILLTEQYYTNMETKPTGLPEGG